MATTEAMPATLSTTLDAPPSPTLTNPDMILPYSNVTSSSPAPIASSPTLHPEISLVLNPSPGQPSRRETERSPEVGVATAVKMPIRIKPGPPTTVLTTYSGYEHGAPLSDIGEEELTPKSRISRPTRSPSPTEPLSPTPPERDHKRRMSDEVSTVASDPGDWESFDSSKMMTGRLAADVAKQQEDDSEDLESKRNSTVLTESEDRDEMAVLNAKAEKILANARKRLTHMEDNLSKARHSVLWSPRSSPNISEAMHQPAGGLYRSISLASTTNRRSRAFPVKTSPLAHSRGSSDTTTGTGLKRLSMIPEARSLSAQEHGRYSETPQLSRLSPIVRNQAQSPASSRSVHSPMHTLEEEDDSPSTTKTSPASNANKPFGLGINTMAQKTHEDLSMPRSSTPTNHARSGSAASTHSIRSQMSDLRVRIVDLQTKTKADKERRQSYQSRNTPSPFTNSSNPEKWYTSAPEYKESGSPLSTNAGVGWSPKHEKQMSLDAQVTPVTPQAHNFLDHEPPTTAESQRFDARTDVNTPSLHKRAAEIPADVEGDESIIQESIYEDAEQSFDDEDQVAASEEEQIYLNEVLEESLHDVEPRVPDIPDEFYIPEGGEAERHEDRLDAFDYENMFLHSAMGNFRSNRRSRTPSTSSGASSLSTRRAEQQTPTMGHRQDDEDASSNEAEDGDDRFEDDADAEIRERSLETPRPHSAEQVQIALQQPRSLAPPHQPWMKPSRSQSVESVSTVATFATATEGGGNEDSEDETPHEILSWGNSSFPAPPVGSPRKEQPPQYPVSNAWPTPPMSARTPQITNMNSNPTPTHSEHPSLSILTGNAFANGNTNGMPTPTQTPLPPSTSNSSRGTPTAITAPYSHSSRPSTSHSTASQVTTRSILQSRPGSRSRSRSHTATSSTATDHPANTEVLMESLIKLADPDFSVGTPADGGKSGNGAFADVDKELVLALLRAVGGVCDGVLKAERRADKEGVQALRTRLDLSRRVLEGEVDEREVLVDGES